MLNENVLFFLFSIFLVISAFIYCWIVILYFLLALVLLVVITWVVFLIYVNIINSKENRIIYIPFYIYIKLILYCMTCYIGFKILSNSFKYPSDSENDEDEDYEKMIKNLYIDAFGLKKGLKRYHEFKKIEKKHKNKYPDWENKVIEELWKDNEKEIEDQEEKQYKEWQEEWKKNYYIEKLGEEEGMKEYTRVKEEKNSSSKKYKPKSSC